MTLKILTLKASSIEIDSKIGSDIVSETGSEIGSEDDASEAEDDSDGEEAPNEVSGSKAAELAKSMYCLIEDVYGLDKNHLTEYRQEASCDSQYQAKDFASKLNKLLNHSGHTAMLFGIHHI